MLTALVVLAIGVDVSTAQSSRPSPVEPPRWEADHVLKQAMTEIRALVLRHHSLITHRRIAPEVARRFAADVQREADRAASGTLLSGTARDEARRLLSVIEARATIIGGAPGTLDAVDALMSIDAALVDYARSFAHPDWQPLR